jgi:hypothetical protein
LSYQEVVKFTDPTGDTAERYFDQAYANLYRGANVPQPGVVRGQPGMGPAPGVLFCGGGVEC